MTSSRAQHPAAPGPAALSACRQRTPLPTLAKPQGTSAKGESLVPDALLRRAAYLGHHIARPPAGPVAERSTLPSERLQRQVVTQIQVQPSGEDGLAVQSLLIVGRPERTFTNTMGDHTTAFAVHRLSLEQQMAGKSLAEAFELLQSLYAKAKQLPGYDLRKALPENKKKEWSRDTHRQRLKEAKVNLATHLAVDPESISTARGVSLLQQAVGAYFEFRELIPLSTINVRAKSPALAGKGKGEASHAEVLRDHQAGNARSVKARIEAALGLFDTDSSTLAAVEQDPDMLAEMAPGLGFDIDILARAELLAAQHVAALETSFPATFDKELTPEQLHESLLTAMKPQLRDWLQATADDVARRQITTGKEQQRLKDSLVLKRNVKDREALNLQNLKADQLKRSARIIAATYKKLYGEEVVPDGSLPLPRKTKKKPKRQRKKKREITDEPKESSAMDIDSTPEKTAETPSDQNEEEEARKSPLAIQLVLADNGTIASLESQGRSPSPFPGTMGAHSTAWIVHLDRVRKAIVGKSGAAAFQAISATLVPEAVQLCKERTKVFDIESDHQSLLTAAKKKLDKTKDLFEDAGGATHLLLLQTYIAQLLTYINFIPGSTLYSADTGGKTEGKYRQRLKDFEAGTRSYKSILVQAVHGLLDLKEVEGQKQRQRLEQDHEQLIKLTYPKTYAAVYGKSSKNLLNENKTSSKKRSREDDDDYWE